MKLSLLPLIPLSALPLLIACTTSSPDEAIVTTTSPIQGGTPDTGHPAVGVLRTVGGYCTGTLITPTTVLTAGHCVRVAGIFAITVDGVEREYRVIAQRTYPGYDESVTGCPSSIRDLAVVRIDQAITDVTPVGVGGAPPPESVCLGVGYGRHNFDAGVFVSQEKYQATEIVEDVSNHSITVKPGDGLADHGDSGGPLLLDDRIVGTASCTTSQYPDPARRIRYERVDQPEALTFIRNAVIDLGSDSNL